MKKSKSTCSKIIKFLGLLEEKLPRGPWPAPVLHAVQRRQSVGGIEVRSVVNKLEHTWVEGLTLIFGSPSGPLNLFLTDDDLDKPTKELVKHVLKIIGNAAKKREQPNANSS